jgi:hypothetical protein
MEIGIGRNRGGWRRQTTKAHTELARMAETVLVARSVEVRDMNLFFY